MKKLIMYSDGCSCGSRRIIGYAETHKYFTGCHYWYWQRVYEIKEKIINMWG